MVVATPVGRIADMQGLVQVSDEVVSAARERRPDMTGLPPLTLGLVSLPAFVCIVAMTFLTVPLGARLTHVLNAVVLRRIFAVFIILAAVNMLRKALS